LKSISVEPKLSSVFLRSMMALLCAGSVLAEGAKDSVTVVTVIGAGGQPEFEKQFEESAANWEKAARQAEAGFIAVGREPGGTNDLTLLEDALARVPREGAEPLWLVLIGHGTFDGKEAKFNLRGPDLSSAQLAKSLEPFRRPLVVLNAASASAPFLNALSRSNRVIVSATRSGQEQKFARLGKHLSEAIANPQADLDKDGQTSLLEAFLSAARQTADWYKAEGRLATEHPLLDDNGDGLGTQADWFRGVRAVKKPNKGSSVDGVRAHQVHLVRNDAEKRLPAEVRARRDELELAIAKLREAKAQMKEEEYYQQLEPLLMDMARLYETAERPGP
jgi:hypothetical protein